MGVFLFPETVYHSLGKMDTFLLYCYLSSLMGVIVLSLSAAFEASERNHFSELLWTLNSNIFEKVIKFSTKAFKKCLFIVQPWIEYIKCPSH